MPLLPDESLSEYYDVDEDERPYCDHCGERTHDLKLVESRDDETGYSERADLCRECRNPNRMTPAEAEQEAYYAKRAMWLLGEPIAESDAVQLELFKGLTTAEKLVASIAVVNYRKQEEQAS